MENKQNKFVYYLMIAICLFSTVSVARGFFIRPNNFIGLYLTAVILEHLYVLYYLFAGYKKPHGNLLKYVMLAFVATLGIEIIVYRDVYNVLTFSCLVISAIIVTYVAGRLNKIDNNTVLMTIVLVLLIVYSISYTVSSGIRGFGSLAIIFGEAIEWVVISSAYFVRYKEHKEAGLTDK